MLRECLTISERWDCLSISNVIAAQVMVFWLLFCPIWPSICSLVAPRDLSVWSFREITWTCWVKPLGTALGEVKVQGSILRFRF